jgi:fructosamine-3-kinase
MFSLFGHASSGFVAAYEDASPMPLSDGWQDRLRLWQLEPLLVHTNLFGGAYGSRSLEVLHHFT